MADGTDLSVLVLTQTATLFVTLLPDVSQMRKSSQSDVQFRTDVRGAEATAAAIALSIGLGAGVLGKSSRPVVVALVAVGLLVVLSEALLRVNSRPITEGTS